MHYDSDETVDLRRITAILYLNPAWRPEHGAGCHFYFLVELHSRVAMLFAPVLQ